MKDWSSNHSQNVNLENGYVLHLNKLRASHEYARGAYWESSSGVGDWYVPNLVAGATYTYEIYNSMVKTDHYYPVTVNVIGATTQSTTFTVSGTTDVVASGNIDADSNGRINFTMSCGVTNYGYGLSWIRIKGLNYDSNGNFLGSSGLTVDSSLVNGNWLKIQIPTFQTLQTVNISEVTTGDGVEEFSILGSSDNSNWTLLQSETSVSLATYGNGGTDYPISTAGNFHYFAVLFRRDDHPVPRQDQGPPRARRPGAAGPAHDYGRLGHHGRRRPRRRERLDESARTSGKTVNRRTSTIACRQLRTFLSTPLGSTSPLLLGTIFDSF